jgi:regulator of protease activity HflC (stomatin/prohibitin superfamily)
MLEKRVTIAEKLKTIVDGYTKEWGVDIQKIELQDVVLPADMQRAFAVQAEAERESKAIIIKATAELTASKTLKEAADNMKDSPIAVQLRILETLSDVSKDQSNTILFALPTETLKGAGFAGLAAAASINSSAARGRTQQ